MGPVDTLVHPSVDLEKTNNISLLYPMDLLFYIREREREREARV